MLFFFWSPEHIGIRNQFCSGGGGAEVSCPRSLAQIFYPTLARYVRWWVTWSWRALEPVTPGCKKPWRHNGAWQTICQSALVVIFACLFIQGGYFSGPQPSRLIRDAILELCHQLKDDAVALIDVVAPPDFILNSPIGCADGEVGVYFRDSNSPILGGRVPFWGHFPPNFPPSTYM